jgi:hypothetical protein
MTCECTTPKHAMVRPTTVLVCSKCKGSFDLGPETEESFGVAEKAFAAGKRMKKILGG